MNVTNWWETTEGVVWLDGNVKIQEMFEDSARISVGTYWEDTDDGVVYLLASPGFRKAVLVSLSSGHRYTDSISVDSVYTINNEEWCELTGEEPDIFINVEKDSVISKRVWLTPLP